MKRFLLLPLIGAVALFGCSCYSEHGSVHTKRSAVLGGALGAGAGALIGEHNDRELEGAAIGGAIGLLTGSVLGSARDEQYHRSSQPVHRSSAPPYRNYNYNQGRYYRPSPSYSFDYHYSPHYRSSYGYGGYSRRGYSRGGNYCR